MSSRAWKWVFVGALIVLALYSAYPPMRVAVKQVQVVKRPAATQDEALKHGVAVGEMYEVSDETAEKFELVKRVAVTPEEALAHDVAEGEEYEIRRKRVFKRLLPLALGERSEEVEVLERREDGTVVEVVTTYVAARIKLGRDLSSGSELLYEMKPQERESSGDEAEDKQTLEDISKDTIQTLRRRIDPQHIKEFSIQKMGANRILIQVPKASRAEVERLKARLVRMGLLEFRLAMPPPVPGGQQSYAEEYKQAWAGKPVPGYDRMMLPVGKGGGEDEEAESRLLLVRAGEAAITGRLLAEVSRTPDKLGRPAVGFKFNREGRKTFATITDRNKGWLLAIILDGKLQSAPVIRERIAGSGIIERDGGFSKEEVDDLVTILHAGSLAVDLELLQESTVGPQLGRDSISRGLRSIAIAGFLVLAFIGVYYLSCGMVADGALILNLVLLTGVMGLLGAALTLPGVAGVLLTIGMAVDANVLIFERIREESAAGKPIHVALRNGYDRAYTTIIDANVTTLLTAVILYLVGTGPVKGFAVTLSAGIVLSMFTALFVTRLALETMLARGWLRQFKMFSILGQPKLAYSRWRVRAYVASAVVIVVGLVAFGMRGSEIYDIDFKGGILMRLSLRKAPSTAQVRSVLAESGFPDAEVQALGSQGGDEGGSPSLHPTDFHVRIKRVGSEDVRSTLLLRVQERLTAAGLAKEKAVKPTSDGRGLIVELNAPVDEMTLRRALAGEGGDPFGIDHIAEVFATGGEQGQRFTIRLAQAPVLAQERKVWADMLSVLQWGGMTRYKEAVTLGEITAGGATAFGQEGPGADASMELSTSRPISGEVLAVGVATFFPKITVQVPPKPADRFTLNGPREALEQFKTLAAGELDLLPAVFDGWSVSVATGVSLPKPVPEDDLRGTAQSKGLGQVWIVGEDLTAQSYQLNLSFEQVMEQMTEVFAPLDEREVTVEFEDVGEPRDELGRVKVKMTLSAPLRMREIEHFLDTELGAAAHGMIAEGFDERASTSHVTLRLPADKLEEAKQLITTAFSRPHPVQKIVSIGSVVAREMTARAILAIICASVVIVFYVGVRFHGVRFGVAAVVALIHDVLITLGVVALADTFGGFGDVKINLPMLAAFLTIMGYSLNDTIVVFDRIRENMIAAGRKVVSAELIDLSINQTLRRTILTSLTTLGVVFVLYVWGGPVLEGLAFTLMVGVAVGTYSSVFIAAPLLLDWNRLRRGSPESS